MIHKETDGLDHLTSLRNGTFKLGLGIGCDIDTHLRYKKNGLVVMAGHANVGKTASILFYFTALAKQHKLKFAVLSSENEIGSIKDDIITFFTGKEVAKLDSSSFEYAHYWLNEHFKFINFEGFFEENKRLMNHRDILNIIDNLPLDHNFTPDAFVLDPYNSLGKDDELPKNQHLYDYTVMAELRIYCKKNNKACYILAHGVTEALRKTHSREHDFAGYTIPLLSADIEGGGKFVNRCDDFVCIHRYTSHKTEWSKTEWHVLKVKNTKTGGKPTFKENPVILRALPNITGFDIYIKEDNFAEPESFKNPMSIEEEYEPKPLPKNLAFEDTVQVSKQKLEADKEQQRRDAIDKEIEDNGIEFTPTKQTK
tara:strand:- start:1522 stop:2625 length:1104 start_codon:yes stop_codon:yes gene_type:complete